jgi:hypothetical protein
MMASKLLASLVAGSLVFSSSVAVAQVGAPALEPAAETGLGTNGESALRGGRSDAVTAIIFGLIIFVIAIWVNRSDEDPEPPPTSP